jgi:hypothetical protein
VAKADTHAQVDVAVRGALLDRVVRSAAFRRAWRTRELLVFLCERAAHDPDHPPHEQEIGTALFGEHFEASVGALVRVQASLLRKKLLHYFSSEGADEPVVIEIPRGAYAPVFRPRTPADDVDAALTLEAPTPRAWMIPLGVLCVALLFASAALYRRLPPPSPRAPIPRRPTVERFWRQIVGNGRPTRLIITDGNLAVFQERAHRWLSAAEYQRGQYRDKPLASARSDPALASDFMDESFTDVGDAAFAHALGQLTALLGVTSEVVPARAATADQLRSANVILSGPRRGNPWLEIFEDRLTLRSKFDKNANAPYFLNAAPAAGEPTEVYATPTEGYCRIAYLPRSAEAGNVLLLTGTDFASSRAGAQLLLDESGVVDLAQRLDAAADRRVPAFEALLRVPAEGRASRSIEWVVLRKRSDDAGPSAAR